MSSIPTPDAPAGGPAAAMPGGPRRPLSSFWAPRYWPAWLLLGWLRLAAAMPFSWMISIHGRFGRLLGRSLKSQRRVVARNLELCFPALDEAERDALLDRHFEAMGICVGEMGLGWFGSLPRLKRLFRFEGLEHLHAALENGKGVILYTGHFTTLEISGPVLKMLVPRFAFMFSRRRNPLLDEMQARRRVRYSHESFVRDNIRAMIRSLSCNAVVWYAPDQAYLGGKRALVDFFGEPAMTNVATSRLARLSGATVLPYFYRRLPGSAGYELRFEPPLENFPSRDPVEDTRRLVARLEAAIGLCPEQYLWVHRRFKGRPPPLPDVYRR